MQIAVLPDKAYRRACGARLRKLIDLLGISYVEAARIMGISKNLLRNYMEGDNPIRPYALYRLSMVKQVDFNYVHLDDWTRLPRPIREALEAEMLSKLEAAEAESPAAETDADA